MNIALRPSGGRGEYELAGRHGDIHVHDLFDRPIFVEVLPGVEINTYSQCQLRDGKPRIRLSQQARNAHPSSLIAAAILLPKPRRTRSETHGTELLQWERFVVQTVRIDVDVRANGSVLFSPLTLRVENADGLKLDISFAERMARVVRVWTAAATAQDAVASAVRAHASAFTSPLTAQVELVRALPDLRAALGEPDGDILPILEKHFSLSTAQGQSVGVLSAEIEEEDFSEDVEQADPAEARIERVRQWRLAAVRGASSSLFRREVRVAYDSRCMFTGRRLPRTDATATAGVDAAHILPWSRYDLDATQNGICLSKECHWAFDAGVFRLAYDHGSNAYVVSIPEVFRKAAVQANFDLASFETIAGPVPRDHLPSNEALWPSVIYLDELNRFLDGQAA